MTHIPTLRIGSTPDYATLVLDGITLYYSYETVIGYRTLQDGLVISENIWGPTTGKHLNNLSRDHSVRAPRDVFERELKAALEDVR